VSQYETYELDEVTLDAETDRAILVRFCDVDKEDAEVGEDKWWIPRSLVEATDMEHVGDEGYVEIPEWFATKEGIL